jgi:hypothetical protein
VCAVCGAESCPVVLPPPDGTRFCSVAHLEAFIQAVVTDEETTARCDEAWGRGNWVMCLHDGGIVRHHRDLRLDERTGRPCPRWTAEPARARTGGTRSTPAS